MDLIGSDGKVYRFLAKPKDDLRKDNRMMEVASILNGLFAKDPASRRRNLLIRRLAPLLHPLTAPLYTALLLHPSQLLGFRVRLMQ